MFPDLAFPYTSILKALKGEKAAEWEERIEDRGEALENSQTTETAQIPRKSFWNELAFYSGYYHVVPIRRTLVNPLSVQVSHCIVDICCLHDGHCLDSDL